MFNVKVGDARGQGEEDSAGQKTLVSTAGQEVVGRCLLPPWSLGALQLLL